MVGVFELRFIYYRLSGRGTGVADIRRCKFLQCSSPFLNKLPKTLACIEKTKYFKLYTRRVFAFELEQYRKENYEMRFGGVLSSPCIRQARRRLDEAIIITVS